MNNKEAFKVATGDPSEKVRLFQFKGWPSNLFFVFVAVVDLPSLLNG